MSWFRRQGAFGSASQITAQTGDRWLDNLLSQVDATMDKPTDELTSIVLARRVTELTVQRSHKRLDNQQTPHRTPLSEDARVPSRPGRMATKVMDYRTKDGLADYGFSIEFRPDVGWRVYIVFTPFHSFQLPYQSIDVDGRCYVDWSAKINSLDDARKVSSLWAELTQRYLHDQEERAFWAELTQRYLHDQEEKSAIPAAPDDHHVAIIPHPWSSVEGKWARDQ